MFPNVTLAASKFQSGLTLLSQRLRRRKRPHDSLNDGCQGIRDTSESHAGTTSSSSNNLLIGECNLESMATKKSRSDGYSLKHPSLSDKKDEVLNCLRSLCQVRDETIIRGEDFLTNGRLDRNKVIKEAEREFGHRFKQEGANVDELVISLAKRQNQEFKKDVRCWRYKSSQRKRWDSTSLSQPSILTLSDTELSTESDSGSRNSSETVVGSALGALGSGQLEECAQTPPHVVTFPPTPTASTGDIHLSCDVPDRTASSPTFDEPSRLGVRRGSSLLTQDGYLSDGREELSDSEVDPRPVVYHHGLPVSQEVSDEVGHLLNSRPRRQLVPRPLDRTTDGRYEVYRMRYGYFRELARERAHLTARRSVSECAGLGHRLDPVTAGSQPSQEEMDVDHNASSDNNRPVPMEAWVDENEPPSPGSSPYQSTLELPRLGTRSPLRSPSSRSDGEDDDDDDLYQ